MANNSQRLQSALAYAAAGLHVVLLGDAGTPKGKVPRFKEWGHKTTLDEEELLSQFEQHPSANIGVLLGPKGGVIDVEFDSPEGRATADKLFGECITPTYESVRSIHRLFKWSGEFPPIQKIEFDGLEIRLGGGDKQTQSVLPPSQHPDGPAYRWLPGLSIHEVDLAELPEELACRICNVEVGLEAAGLSDAGAGGEARPREHWDKINAGVSEGGRNEALTSLIGRQLRQVESIEDDQTVADQFALIEAWNDRNKPPLSQRELRATFQSILNRERRRRVEEAFDEVVPSTTSEQVNKAAGLPGAPKNGKDGSQPQGLRLVIIQGSPAVYRLYSPRFSASNGYIELTGAQLGSFSAVRTQAAEQAFTWLPDEMRKRWSNRNGIVQQLFATAERVDPDTAYHRPATLAEAIVGLIARGAAIEPEELRKNGVRSGTGVDRLGDGGAVISLTRMLAYLKAENVVDQIKQKEVAELLRTIGAQEGRSNSARWWELNKPAIARLRALFLSGTVQNPGKCHALSALADTG